MFTHTSKRSVKGSKEQEARIVELQAEIEALRKQLGEDNEERILQQHIKLLHEYNEAKDATQTLLGRLAVLKGTTVRQLHEDYDLTKND